MSNERSDLISRLVGNAETRRSFLRAKLNVNIPSQIRALRRRREMTQQELADKTGMKQSRVSAIESPGAVNFNLETLVRLAAAFRVALAVQFVPFSEMVDLENEFSQDRFDVTTIDDDAAFIEPARFSRASDDLARSDSGDVLREMIEPPNDRLRVVSIADGWEREARVGRAAVWPPSVAGGERNLNDLVRSGTR